MSTTIDPPDRQQTSFTPREIRETFIGVQIELIDPMGSRRDHRDRALQILEDPHYEPGLIAALYQGGAEYEGHLMSSHIQARNILESLKNSFRGNDSPGSNIGKLSRLIGQQYRTIK